MSETAEKILDIIINCQMSTYTAMYAPEIAVITISNIINLCDGLTKYKTRKALEELVANGLIRYTSQGCPAIVSVGEYEELVEEARPPINGYALTTKGFNSELYRKRYIEWCESMRKWATYNE